MRLFALLCLLAAASARTTAEKEEAREAAEALALRKEAERKLKEQWAEARGSASKSASQLAFEEAQQRHWRKVLETFEGVESAPRATPRISE